MHLIYDLIGLAALLAAITAVLAHLRQNSFQAQLAAEKEEFDEYFHTELSKLEARLREEFATKS